MLNFIPKRCPSVTLLFGKRPIQRIEVGHRKNHVEIPLSVIQKIYENVNSSKEYHNKDYHPLHWKAFLQLKLNAFYLHDAAKSGQTPKTALTDLHWYPKLTLLYKGHVAKTLADISTAVTSDVDQSTAKSFYPIQGQNI